MNYPKSILLEHRKNMEWFNKRFVPFMRQKYSCRFTIVCNDPEAEFRKRCWVSKEDFVINRNELYEESMSQIIDEQEIFSSAREYEKNYSVTYLRDAFAQDRIIATKIFDSYSKNPIAGDKISLNSITNSQNYFFDYFEKHISKYKIDLVIARPDSSTGFAIISIAEKNNIPSTIQQTTRENGFYYWSDGPYLGFKQIQIQAEKLKTIKHTILNKNSKKDNVIGSHAFKYNDKFLNRLSFYAMVDGVTYTLKDRLNWFIKDVKKGKLGKRVPMIPKILSKINTYRDHKYFQKIFESDIKTIENKPFIYFPLPMEPEYSTHSLSKEFINVHAMVQQAALSMPSGYNLVVKEHPPNVGLKSRDFYTSLMKIPNIIFANYFIPGPDLVDRAESVITISGSSALEAAERGKMAIVLATSVEYMYLPNIIAGHSMRDFPDTIKKSLIPISKEKKKEIIYSFQLYKEAIKKCGYYAPNTPLFEVYNNSKETLSQKELEKAAVVLLDLWFLQQNKTRNINI